MLGPVTRTDHPTRTTTRRLRLLLVVLLVPVFMAACSDDLGLEEKLFHCAAEEDCAPGFTCNLAVCACRPGRSTMPAEAGAGASERCRPAAADVTPGDAGGDARSPPTLGRDDGS